MREDFILYQSSVLFNAIFHLVADNLILYFLQILAEDEPEKYQSHFSEYIKRGIEADGIEALYKKVHAAIRADPTLKKSDKQLPKEHKR